MQKRYGMADEMILSYNSKGAQLAAEANRQAQVGAPQRGTWQARPAFEIRAGIVALRRDEDATE